VHFNLVDLALVALFVAAVVDGSRRGFGPYAAEFLAVSMGLAVALFGYRPIAGALHAWFGVREGLAAFGTFLLLLLFGHGLALTGVRRWTGWLTGHMDRAWGVDMTRRAGAVPAVGTALLVSALLLSALVVLPGQSSWVLGSSLGNSIARPSSFLQPALRTFLLPAARENQTVFEGGDSGVGEDAFFALRLGPDLQTESDVQGELRMLDLVNRSRQDNGLRPLTIDSGLQAAARAHSLDMYKRAYFSHATPDHKTPFDRINEQKVHYVTAGENIAFAPSPEDAFRSLMNSPDHRANILNPDFRCIGIGAIKGNPTYGEMFTQDFADCR
jgi:uncharacterized protein YkwD